MTATRVFANTEEQVKQLLSMYFFISAFLPLFMIFASPNLINQAVGGMPLPRLRGSVERTRDLEGEVIRDGNHKVNSNCNPRIENSDKNKVSRGNEMKNKEKALSSSESAVGSSCKYGTLIKVAPHPL